MFITYTYKVQVQYFSDYLLHIFEGIILTSLKFGLLPVSPDREIRQRDVTKFHLQLALSLILMLIVFVAGIDQTENTTTFCCRLKVAQTAIETR